MDHFAVTRAGLLPTQLVPLHNKGGLLRPAPRERIGDRKADHAAADDQVVYTHVGLFVCMLGAGIERRKQWAHRGHRVWTQLRPCAARVGGGI